MVASHAFLARRVLSEWILIGGLDVRAPARKGIQCEGDPAATVSRLSGDRLGAWLSHEPGLALVLFDAPWSAACHLALDALVALKKDLEGRVRMRAVDAVGCPKAARRFGIECVPTLILFRGGRAVARWEGARSHLDLKREMRAALVSAIPLLPATTAAEPCCGIQRVRGAADPRVTKRGARSALQDQGRTVR